MKAFDRFLRFFMRFRYPVSLPEDVAGDIGIPLPRYTSIEEIIDKLTCPTCRPTRIRKYMRRDRAEDAFQHASRKEKFLDKSLFSYYFNEGWLEFKLTFDKQSQLRRIYLQHKVVEDDLGVEIPIYR